MQPKQQLKQLTFVASFKSVELGSMLPAEFYCSKVA
jgi:hypothetical protein